MERETLDLGVLSSSHTLGIEILLKDKLLNKVKWEYHAPILGGCKACKTSLSNQACLK